MLFGVGYGFPTYVVNTLQCDEHYSRAGEVRRVEGDKGSVFEHVSDI